ncbi:MAG: PEP/pyruvate-binding domain-containing protein [Georgfuchsia sp.]
MSGLSPRSATLDSGSPSPPTLVRPLAAITEQDRSYYGVKAWNLARLARAGLPVPAGFCIPGNAFPPGWSKVDDLPVDLTAAIRCEYSRLGSPVVAVRSSAGDEDQPERSGAGLYTSLLGVCGEADLLRAILACWQARLSLRVNCGRREEDAPPMAILVQVQVAASAAGVLFTADPLSGASDRLVINAVWGLGEPLASGRVCGDLFHATPTGELLQQVVSCKTSMLTAAGERPVALRKRQKPALSALQIRRLAGLARLVIDHFRDTKTQALDIEFAITGGQPVLLQARPVPFTAQRKNPNVVAYLASQRQRLAKHIEVMRRQGIIRGHEVILSAGNIGELLPTPTMFSFALFCHIFAGRDGAIVRGRRRLGYRLPTDAGEGLFVLVGGQAYFNLEIDAATYDCGVAIPLLELLQAVEQNPVLASYPELELYPRLVASAPGGNAAAAAFRMRMLKQGQSQRQRMQRLLPLLQQERLLPAAQLANLDFAALQSELRTCFSLLKQIGMRFVIVARLGFFFAGSLRCRLQELLPERAERYYASLLQGLPGSLITEQGLDLERLAAGKLSHAEYMERYGHMSSNELELLHPRLNETPQRLPQQVAELLASGRQPSHEFARQERRRRRTEAVLRRRYGQNPEVLNGLQQDLHMTQFFLPLRETLKFHLAARYAPLRPLLQAMARRLDLPPETLFHLMPDEILSLRPETRDSFRAQAADRRDERQLARWVARNCPLPRVIFGNHADVIEAMAFPDGEVSILSMSANPIAPGIAEGIVHCLILDDGGLDIVPPELSGGEILVTTSANLGLAPLFRTVGGVVVEVGGVLAHCACQAREAGIPALVMAGATKCLRHGDRVRLDAQRGVITILELAPRAKLFVSVT